MSARQIKNQDILFVSNFSAQLDLTHDSIAKLIPNDTKYKILTYRKTNIKNSISYEQFIEENFSYIEEYRIEDIYTEFSDVNLYLPVVNDRFISNYYFGIENTLGHKELSLQEINFFIKSFVLFISLYIKKSKIVFSGYADNSFSMFAYFLAKHHNKKCLTFHQVSLIDNVSNFIFEGVYGKPYHNLITKKEKKPTKELVKFMKNYDLVKDKKFRHAKNKTTKSPILGVISPNILNWTYLKWALFGYQTKEHLKVYMNIDKPNIYKKIKANAYRIINKYIAKIYLDKFNFSIEDNLEYIYYPLQTQPEASTSCRAPYHMNQLATIESLSKSLPLGYQLIVKDHPNSLGVNSLFLYKKISDLPNVALVNNKIKGSYYIEISKLVVGFGGTTLFESVIAGKKYLMLNEGFYYTDSKYIYKAGNKCNLFNVFFDVLHDEKVVDHEEEVYKMLNFFYQRGFPRFVDFEKNIADNLMKIYEMEKNNE